MQSQEAIEDQQLITPRVHIKRHQTKFDDNTDNLIKVNNDLSSYERMLDCCGSFWGTMRAWLPCIFFMCPYPYVEVRQGSKGLHQKFGKFQKVLEPGLHLINPCTDQVILSNQKTYLVDLPQQVIMTRDNVTISIDTIVYFRAVDAVKSTYRITQIHEGVHQMTLSALRTICGENTLQQLLEKKQVIADEIEDFVFQNVAHWGIIQNDNYLFLILGVYVEQVFIKDMEFSQDLQNNLSMVPKTEKLSQAKIISAKSDVESAKFQREAADILDNPAAMQIRYFETVQGIAKSSNPKVLFLGLYQAAEKK